MSSAITINEALTTNQCINPIRRNKPFVFDWYLYGCGKSILLTPDSVNTIHATPDFPLTDEGGRRFAGFTRWVIETYRSVQGGIGMRLAYGFTDLLLTSRAGPTRKKIPPGLLAHFGSAWRTAGQCSRLRAAGHRHLPAPWTTRAPNTRASPTPIGALPAIIRLRFTG